MSTYFTSDFHFNHINITGSSVSNWSSGYRNFSSVDEMNETIIERFNSRVKSNDILYLLGDVIMGKSPEHTLLQFISRLNCKTIYLVYGNHDKVIRKNPHCQNLFAWCKDYHEERFNGYLFCMSHYAFSVWNEIGRGSINLHGHSHGTHKGNGRQMDIGVDTNDFYPYHLDEILDRMLKIDPVQVDHHSNNTSYH